MLKKIKQWFLDWGQDQNLQNKQLNILIVRADRLGDVVLSTPVFDVVKRHYPKSKLSVLARSQVRPILEGLASVDTFFTFDPDGVHSGFRGFIRLYQQIRASQFVIAIVLQSNWKIALALYLARVKYRVGPLSKLHSYFYYNRGVRQRRSHVEMHETDYNLQLLRRLGIRVGTRNVPTQVALSEQSVQSARQWLLSQGWNPAQPLIVIHPGMGGSALNWPEAHYVELTKSLAAEGRQLLISGGALEVSLLDRFEKELEKSTSRVMFFKNRGEYSVDFLGGLFSFAELVIAPSTGPLHLAVALGKPVVTFFPPIRVQSALRWGPYVRDESRASILVPEVYCGQDFKCIGNLCHYYPCMKGITVKQALNQVKSHLKESEDHAKKD